MLNPQIRQLPALKVIGLQIRFNRAGSPQIAQLWTRFLQRSSELGRAGRHVGVVLADPQAGEMRYLAGVVQWEDTLQPEDMITAEVPAGKYAVFIHRGPVQRLGETMTAIFRDWLPRSGYRHGGGPEVELYDDRFRPDSDDSEMEICVPIQ